MKNYRDGQGRTSGVPEVWVYEKVDSIPRKPEDLCRIDRTDYPFEPDEDVLGLWHVRDFYNWKIEENFDPNKQNFPKEDLFVQEMQFFPDGQCIQTTKNHTRHLRYVGATDDRPGYVLNEAVGTASAYTVREIEGKAYLIVEWKTGDYQYGSEARVYWYVFVR